MVRDFLALGFIAGAIALLKFVRVPVKLTASTIAGVSVGDAWGFVTDPRHIPLWNPRIADVRVDGPLPLNIGSRFRYAVVGANRRVECTAEIVEQRAPEFQRTIAQIGHITGIQIYRFEEIDGKTRITVSLETRVTLAHGAVLWTRGRTRVLEDVERMKRALETRG